MRNFQVKIILLCILSVISTKSYSQAFSKDDPIGTIIKYQKGENKDDIEQQTLIDKKSTAQGEELTIILDDNKDIKLKYLLTDHKLIWDMNNLLGYIEMSDEGKKAHVTNFSVSGDQISIPLDPHIDAKYKDEHFNVSLRAKGVKVKIDFDVTNRHIIGTEMVQTPTANYEAYVLSSDWTVNINFLLLLHRKEEIQSLQWIVPGVGIVKEQSIFKNNSLGSSDPKLWISKQTPMQ